MIITIDTATATPGDYEALVALISAKSGLLSSTGLTLAKPPAPPAPDMATVMLTPPPAPLASEALIAKAASEATPPAPGADVDTAGMPWDVRIHASTKAKNADGSWRVKRGVDSAVFETVTAELKALMALPPPPAAVMAAGFGPAVDPAAAFGMVNAGPLAPGAETPPPLAPVPAAPVAAVPPPPVVAAAAVETAVSPFAALMKRITERQAAGTLPTEIVTAACLQLRLPSIVALAQRPDLIASFEALLP